jgi:hypothetical protein
MLVTPVPKAARARSGVSIVINVAEINFKLGKRSAASKRKAYRMYAVREKENTAILELA